MKPGSKIYSRYFTYIKPITKIPIIRTYGSTIFSLLVMIVFIIFAVKPTVETIFVLQKKLTETKQILDKLTQKTNNLDKAKQNYDNLGQDIKDKISAAIPDNIQLSSVIAVLEQISKNHDASISALQIQPQTIIAKSQNTNDSTATDSSNTSSDNVSEISFAVNLTGDYGNLLSVLSDLRNSSRLISLDKISVSQLSSGSGLFMSISGRAYYLK